MFHVKPKKVIERLQTCELKGTGCYDWSSITSCSAGQTCSGGNCVSACVPETNVSFCSRLGKNCSYSDLDNCGVMRTNVDCGSCSGATPQTPCQNRIDRLPLLNSSPMEGGNEG